MNNNFVYSNSPNHYYDSMQHAQGINMPYIKVEPVIDPLKYTHYDFLQDFFNKYYKNKLVDPQVVLHLTKIIELSLIHTQDVSGLLLKYKEYFKL